MNIEILIGRNLNQSESIILNHFMDPFFVLNSNIYFLSYVFCQEMPFLDIWNPQKRPKLVYYAKKPLAPQIYVGRWDIIFIHNKFFFCIFPEKMRKINLYEHRDSHWSKFEPIRISMFIQINFSHFLLERCRKKIYCEWK